MSGTVIVSCGGVVIHRNKVLLLYKNQSGRHQAWVLPKGSIEDGETFPQTALREVEEESGVTAHIVKYLGETHYTFKGALHQSKGIKGMESGAKETKDTNKETICKTVHWYLMSTSSFYCKPQAEEYFADVGFYKQHEAYHLLKFHDERQIMRHAFREYVAEAQKPKKARRHFRNSNNNFNVERTNSK